MRLQLLHRRVRILGLPLLGRLIALPLDEAATDGVVLLLVEDGVAAHQLARHGVRVREVPLGLVVDDVLERHRECLVADFYRESLIWFRGEAVEELRFDRRRLFADDTRQRRTLSAVALTSGAQA